MPLTVVIDCLDPDVLVPFWATALGYRFQEVPGLEPYRVLLPQPEHGSGAPVVALQRVPEPKLGKNRVHLDVHVTPDRRDALLAELVAHGGRPVGEPVHIWEGLLGTWWQVIADPEGNELCLVVDPSP